MHKLIWLTGYRGSGKTAVGEVLARRLGWEFIDADAYLELSAGVTIRDIFRTQGEPAFRDLESKILLELSARQDCAIATGGGAILREANRKILGDTGTVVWLRAPAQVLLERIEADPTSPQRRPDLTAMGGLAEIETLLFLREPMYRKIAAMELDTSLLSPEEVADRILLPWKPSTTTSPG